MSTDCLLSTFFKPEGPFFTGVYTNSSSVGANRFRHVDGVAGTGGGDVAAGAGSEDCGGVSGSAGGRGGGSCSCGVTEVGGV